MLSWWNTGGGGVFYGRPCLGNDHDYSASSSTVSTNHPTTKIRNSSSSCSLSHKFWFISTLTVFLKTWSTGFVLSIWQYFWPPDFVISWKLLNFLIFSAWVTLPERPKGLQLEARAGGPLRHLDYSYFLHKIQATAWWWWGAAYS